MKIKLLGLIILSIMILPVLGGVAMAACSGDCITTDACAAKGGTSTAGLCSGAANIQCCVVKSTSETALTSVTSSAKAGSVEIPNPLKVTSISALIDRIVTYIIEIATILLPLAIIYGAYLFMSAGGDPEKIIKGRQTILWTIIGYALILISKGVALIVAEILGGKS